MNEALAIAFGILPQILFFFAIYRFVRWVQKKTFGVLLSKFKSTAPGPSHSHRATQFKYGKNLKISNAVKVAETAGELYIKTALIPSMRIPFSQIDTAHKLEGPLKSSIFVLSFKDSTIQDVEIHLKNENLSQFPELLRRATGSDYSHLTQSRAKSGPSNKHMNKIIAQQGSMPPTNMNELKSSAGNWARAFVAIFALIVLMTFLLGT
jgi:hypothetical protein